MKKNRIILYISLVAATFAGCSKDFLNEKPEALYTPGTLQDALGFEASIVGMYNHLSTFFTYSDRQGWPSVWQVGTDVANATANQEGIEIPYYNYSLLTPADAAASVIWQKDYTLINQANAVVDGAVNTTAPLTQAEKDKFAAEAKFFRAYAYNSLATLFGGVPLITHSITGPKTDFVRAPLADVNKQIEDDLLFASANLPDVTTAKAGRVNKYAAMQLLAEVYLRMGKPALAEQQAQAIISSNKFSLIKARYGAKATLPGDYYSDMFAYGSQRRNQGNTEAIWVLEQENPSKVVGGITGAAQQRRVWQASYHNVPGMIPADSLGGRANARLRLSNWVLYGLYAPGDIRNSRWNIRRQLYYNDPAPAYASKYGKPVPYTGPDTLTNLTPHTTKWGAFDPNDVFGFAMIKDFILMRLGETYLLLAEAQFKQNNFSGAATSINELRKRAFANYPTSGQVQASDITMDFILDERARELIGEENRRMTLMRTGTLVDRAIKLNSGDKQKPLAGLTTKNLLLPIPLTEIQLNKDAVLEQNPGY